MIEYNEQRPHDSLGEMTPVEYRQHVAGSSTSEVSA
ncbi:integrase core domain-containing protein, partial [Immundisolibacter sp.]